MSGQMDVVLAGAVNRADDLFIHGVYGFKGIESVGRSLPFSAVPMGCCLLRGLDSYCSNAWKMLNETETRYLV